VKVFVYEFASGGGFAGQPLVPGLAREGDMMLRALLDDLALLPGIDIVATRDPRLPPLPAVETIDPAVAPDPAGVFARGVAAADAAWPTAPESSGTLEHLARETLRQRRLLLGCRPDAVRLTASKRATALALRAAGIPVVPTYAAADELPATPGSWVVKPDDGAGCDGTFLVPDWRAAVTRLDAAPHGLVAQPWIDGTAMSLSLLCADGRAMLLSCNVQHASLVDDRLAVEGITVNAVRDHDGAFAALATRIAAAVPGLWGYVGVDLMRTPAGPVVLEINPRLTTSYCGLRRARGLNVAAMVLNLARPGAFETGPAAPEGRAVELALEACRAA
jgi:predicted ATP-grasp superfamily ATP-dependent carboligase